MLVREVPWWGVVSSAACPVLLLAGWTAAASLQPRFDPVADTVSALAALESRGLIERRSDPADGRRAVMHITRAGMHAMSDKRNVRIGRMTRALSDGFTPAELAQLTAAAPLIERLAASI
jgi:hypothetical protein